MQAWYNGPKKCTSYHYPKTIVFLVKCLTLFKLIYLCVVFVHTGLYCCAKHSNLEYQDRVSILIIKNNAKIMAIFGFGHKFHDLNYFEYD